MPFEAYKIYQEYEKDKYKTSIQKKAEKALEEAEKEGIKPPEKESFDFDEAREIFKEDFLGIEEMEKFTGYELSDEEKRLAEEKWQEKIDVMGLDKESLEKLKKEGFMIILRIPTLLDENNKEMPATILNLRKKFPLFYKQDWYKNEQFVKESIKDISWGIVKKEILEESRSQNWDQQSEILKQWAKDHNIDHKLVKRRTPQETAYDILAYFKTNNQRILEKDWDWSGVRSSPGGFVHVGDFASDGLNVCSGSRARSDSVLGVCPAS